MTERRFAADLLKVLAKFDPSVKAAVLAPRHAPAKAKGRPRECKPRHRSKAA